MKVYVAMCVLLFSTLVNASPLNNLVIFGDSLSDNGNLYEYLHHRMPQSPPYYKGRFTNGPVWIEQLTSSFFPNKAASHLLDYAYGGAAIAENAADDNILFTLNREINTYLLEHQNKADPSSLFVIWIGGNNYLALPENEESVTTMVTQGVAAGIERLIQAGAQSILVLNLPDLGRIPAAREFHAEEKLTRLTKRHNDLLADAVNDFKIKYPNVQWLYFDVYKAVNEFFLAPEKYGFTNIIDTCYDISINEPGKDAILLMTANINKPIKSNCEGYLFFDPVHPTALAHRFLADKVQALLTAA